MGMPLAGTGALAVVLLLAASGPAPCDSAKVAEPRSLTYRQVASDDAGRRERAFLVSLGYVRE